MRMPWRRQWTVTVAWHDLLCSAPASPGLNGLRKHSMSGLALTSELFSPLQRYDAIGAHVRLAPLRMNSCCCKLFVCRHVRTR
jgi:hypothetical protein